MVDPRRYRILGQRHLLVHPELPDQSGWWYIGRARPAAGYRMSHGEQRPGDVLVQLVWRAAAGTRHLASGDRALAPPVALLVPDGHDELDWSLAADDPRAELTTLLGRGAWLQRAIAELADRHGPILSIDPDLAIWRELHRIAGRPRQPPLVQDGGEAMALAARSIAGLLPSSSSVVSDLAERAADELLRRIATPAAIGEVADLLAVSREHLTRRFTRHHGEPPASWLRRRRLDLARRLLTTTDDSVAQIGAQVGYPAPDRFARAFAAHHGCSPSALRSGSG